MPLISFSELDNARQCLFKHDLVYKQRWVSPRLSPALSRGTLWHSVLEMHYRLLQSVQLGDAALKLSEVVQRVKREFLFDGMSQSEEQELVEWMYDGYVELYGDDPDWKVLAVEHAPVVWLPTDRGGRSRFQLKLKIDLVVRDASMGGKLVIVDHKSGKDLPKDKELDIDDQFGLYTWAMRKLGKKVFGSVHSAARTHRNKDQERHPQPLSERFKRTPLYRTDLELDAIAIDAYRTARVAYSHRIGLAPRSPNPDTCRWRCDYTEPCLLSRKGDDVRAALIDMQFYQDFERH